MNNSKNLIHITKHSDGTKMDMFRSISTNCLLCGRCRKRAENEKTICNKCYAETYLKMRATLREHLTQNTEVLTKSIIPVELLPRINDRFFRLEAFADLNNTIQAINYFNICYKNNYTTFALWTKNPDFIHNAIQKGYKKPDNLIIVYSGVFVDRVNKIPEKYAYFIDKIFNVWTSVEAASKHGKVINCGKKHCIDCLLCYTDNNVKEINELLK